MAIPDLLKSLLDKTNTKDTIEKFKKLDNKQRVAVDKQYWTNTSELFRPKFGSEERIQEKLQLAKTKEEEDQKKLISLWLTPKKEVDDETINNAVDHIGRFFNDVWSLARWGSNNWWQAIEDAWQEIEKEKVPERQTEASKKTNTFQNIISHGNARLEGKATMSDVLKPFWWAEKLKEDEGPLETNQDIKDNVFKLQIGWKYYTETEAEKLMDKMTPEQLTYTVSDIQRQLDEHSNKTEEIEIKDPAISRMVIDTQKQQIFKEEYTKTLTAPDGTLLGIQDGKKTPEQIKRETVVRSMIQSFVNNAVKPLDELWSEAGSYGMDSDSYILWWQSRINKVADVFKKKWLSLSDEEINKIYSDEWFKWDKVKEFLDDEEAKDALHNLAEYITINKVEVDRWAKWSYKNANRLQKKYADASIWLRIINDTAVANNRNFIDSWKKALVNDILFWTRADISSDIGISKRVAKKIWNMVIGMDPIDVATLWVWWVTYFPKAFRAASAIQKTTKAVKTAEKALEIAKATDNAIKIARATERLATANWALKAAQTVEATAKLSTRFSGIKKIYDTIKAVPELTRPSRIVMNGLKEAITELPFNLLVDSYDPDGMSIAFWPGLDFSMWIISSVAKHQDEITTLIKSWDAVPLPKRVDQIQKRVPAYSAKQAWSITKEELKALYDASVWALSSGKTETLWILSGIAHMKNTSVNEGQVRTLVSWLQNLAKSKQTPELNFVAKNILAFMKPVTTTLRKIDAQRVAWVADNFDELLTKSYQEFVGKYDNNFLGSVVWKKMKQVELSNWFVASKEALRKQFIDAWKKPTEEQLDIITQNFLVGWSDAKYVIADALWWMNFRKEDIDNVLADISETVENTLPKIEWAIIEDITPKENIIEQIIEDVADEWWDAEKGVVVMADMLMSNKVNPTSLIKFWWNATQIDPKTYKGIGDFIGTSSFAKILAKAVKFSNSLTGWKKLWDIQKWLNDIVDYALDFAISSKFQIDDLLPTKLDWSIVPVEKRVEQIQWIFSEFINFDTAAKLSKVKKNADLVSVWKDIQKDMFLNFLKTDVSKYKKSIKENMAKFVSYDMNSAVDIENYIQWVSDSASAIKNLVASSITKSNIIPERLLTVVEALINKSVIEKELTRLNKINGKGRPIKPWEALDFDSELFQNMAAITMWDTSVIKNADEVLALMMNGDVAAQTLWSKRVQSARETVLNVYDAILNKKDINIHHLYLTSYGRETLNNYMSAKLSKEQYKEYLKKYNEFYERYAQGEQDQMSAILTFWDESTGKLNMKIDTWNGFVSLGDFLLGRQVSYGKSAIVESPLPGLFKFLSQWDNSDFLTKFFNYSFDLVEAETDTQRLVKQLGEEGKSRYNIYDGIRKKVIDVLAKEDGIIDIESAASDIVDPLLYSHKQYFSSLPENANVSSIEDLEYLLLNMVKKYGWGNSAYINKVIDTYPNKIATELSSTWYALKNIDYTESARDLADFMKITDITDLNMNKAVFSEYLYKFFLEGMQKIGTGAKKWTQFTSNAILRDLWKMEGVDINPYMDILIWGTKNQKLQAISDLRSFLKTPLASSALDYIQAWLEKTKTTYRKVSIELLNRLLSKKSNFDFWVIDNIEVADTFRRNYSNVIKNSVNDIIRRASDPEAKIIEWWEKDKLMWAIQKRVKDMEKKYKGIEESQNFDIGFNDFKSRDEQFYAFIDNIAKGKTNLITYNVMKNKGYMRRVIDEANRLSLDIDNRASKKFYRVDRDWSVVFSTDQKLNAMRRYFLGMNSYGWILARDEELLKTTQLAIKRQASWFIKYDWEAIRIGKYQDIIQSKYIDILNEEGKLMSQDETIVVIADLVKSRESKNFKVPDNWTAKQKKLYNFMLDDVVNPLNDFRRLNWLWEIKNIKGRAWESLGLWYFLTKWVRESDPYLWLKRKYNALTYINSMFWFSMFMPVDDIVRISSNSKYGNITNFTRDFMLNGANDWALLDKAIAQIWTYLEKWIRTTWKAAAQTGASLAFFLPKGLASFSQQTIQSLLYGTSVMKAHKVDEKLLDAINMFMDNNVTYDWQLFKLKWRTDALNYLVLSDKVAASSIQKWIISQALYMLSEWWWEQYAKHFLDMTAKANEFMGRFKITRYDEFTTNAARRKVDMYISDELAKLDDLISKWEWDIDALIIEREKVSNNFYMNEFRNIKEFVLADFLKFKSFYDASIASHFVTSQIKTLTQIPFMNSFWQKIGLDKFTRNSPKFLFGLMKWSMSTFGRRSTKILDELYQFGDGNVRTWLKWLVDSIITGNSNNHTTMFINEVAMMYLWAIKANYQAERISWEKYDLADIIIQPLAAFHMLFSSVYKAINTAESWYNISASDWQISWDEFIFMTAESIKSFADDLVGKIAIMEYLGAKDIFEAVQTWRTTGNIYDTLTSLFKDYIMWWLLKVATIKASWLEYQKPNMSDGDFLINLITNSESEKTKWTREMSESQYTLWQYSKFMTDPGKYLLDYVSTNAWLIGMITWLFSKNTSSVADKEILQRNLNQFKVDSWVAALTSQFSRIEDYKTATAKYNSQALAALLDSEKTFEKNNYWELSNDELIEAMRKKNPKFKNPMFTDIMAILSPTPTNLGSERNLTFDITKKEWLREAYDQAVIDRYGEWKSVDKDW